MLDISLRYTFLGRRLPGTLAPLCAAIAENRMSGNIVESFSGQLKNIFILDCALWVCLEAGLMDSVSKAGTDFIIPCVGFPYTGLQKGRR